MSRKKVPYVEKRTYEDRKEYQKQYLKNWIEKNPDKWFANQHYGMPLEEYQKRLTTQKGLCEICGDYARSNFKAKHVKQELFVDHDHNTGKWRGLLCQQCNTGLGAFSDNIEYMKKAIEYLLKHKAST